MCSVRDHWQDYQNTEAVVVGISTDSVESHRGFAEKYSLPLTLLANPDGSVVAKYGVKSWLPGRASRAVVVIDKQGVIRHYRAQTLGLFPPKDDDVIAAIAKANAA
jgi:peroxiredoxin Q/BCP